VLLPVRQAFLCSRCTQPKNRNPRPGQTMWKGYKGHAAAQANRPPNRGPPSPTGTRPILTGSLTYGGNQQGLAQEPPPAQAFMGPKEQVPADVNGGNLIPRLGPTNLVQEQQQQPPRPFLPLPQPVRTQGNNNSSKNSLHSLSLRSFSSQNFFRDVNSCCSNCMSPRSPHLNEKTCTVCDHHENFLIVEKRIERMSNSSDELLNVHKSDEKSKSTMTNSFPIFDKNSDISDQPFSLTN